MIKFLQPILEGLAPNYCYLCGLRSYREYPLCSGCQSDLMPNNHCCSLCALPLRSASSAPPATRCGQCLQNPPAYNRVIAPWLYDEKMAFLLHRWKFQGERRLTSVLAYLWLNQSGPCPTQIDLIIPVPLHWTKLLRRGFNQSELLCLALQHHSAALRNTKINCKLVQRHRATSPQSTLPAPLRKSNLRGAFTARQRCDNLRIAIVDDVLTTGSTATAMATTLRDAGASYIEIWCLARTPEPRD
jgi:ComF family protein